MVIIIYIFSSAEQNTLAILGVIYENLCRQGRLVNKYGLEQPLKAAILGNYSLIQELFTLKLFNRALAGLVSKGITISSAEFEKYGILNTLSS